MLPIRSKSVQTQFDNKVMIFNDYSGDATMKNTTLLFVSACLLASIPAAAQIGDLGNVVDKKCVNGVVTVKGSGNLVTVQGYCAKAVVGGNGNVLRIDRVGAITISGNGNLVEYRYLNPNPKKPSVKTHPAKTGGGTGNSVSWTKGADFTKFGGM
jgi:Protein of unknown function (DUF3060)